jgi:hypothetical protein
MESLNRRGLITGLIAFAAAPAIVRAESLMKVKAYVDPAELSATLINKIYQNSQYGKFAEYAYIYFEDGELKRKSISAYEFYKDGEWQ